MKCNLFIGLNLILCALAHAQTDSIFEAWDTDNMPGIAVAVQYRGEVVHHRGYGMATLEHKIPITSHSVFDIASVSKQFCAFAIAMLAEKEKLALDDDIRTYLPEIPDFGHIITVRHLIYHTSGLRDWPEMLALSGRTMEDVISMEEILHFVLHQKTLNFIPGTQYRYSNTGYNLLALIIERISGQSFREFMNDNVFIPLGMTKTHFQDDHTEIVPGRVASYRSQFGKLERIGNGLMAVGSSSLHTTSEDLLKWMQNFDDQNLGSSAVHAMMNMQGQLSDGTIIPYGFGLIHGSYRGLRTISHSGEWAGFRAIILQIPDYQFAMTILGNHASLNVSHLAKQVVLNYLESYMSPLSEIPVNERNEFMPEEYEGVYDFGRAKVIQLIARDNSLFAHLPPDTERPVQSMGADSLMIPGLNLTLTFARDSLSKVTHAFTRNIEAVRFHLPKEMNLSPYEGCYLNLLP